MRSVSLSEKMRISNNFNYAIARYRSVGRAIKNGHVDNFDFSVKRRKNNRKRTKYRRQFNTSNI